MTSKRAIHAATALRMTGLTLDHVQLLGIHCKLCGSEIGALSGEGSLCFLSL